MELPYQCEQASTAPPGIKRRWQQYDSDYFVFHFISLRTWNASSVYGFRLGVVFYTLPVVALCLDGANQFCKELWSIIWMFVQTVTPCLPYVIFCLQFLVGRLHKVRARCWCVILMLQHNNRWAHGRRINWLIHSFALQQSMCRSCVRSFVRPSVSGAYSHYPPGLTVAIMVVSSSTVKFSNSWNQIPDAKMI